MHIYVYFDATNNVNIRMPRILYVPPLVVSSLSIASTSTDQYLDHDAAYMLVRTNILDNPV